MKKKLFYAVFASILLAGSATMVNAAEIIKDNINENIVAIDSNMLSSTNLTKLAIQDTTAPILEEAKATVKPAKKLTLKAVIFDPKADFEAYAKQENREMTIFERWESNTHEKLHGEVKETSKLSTKGMLDKYLTHDFENGNQVKVWSFYRGALQNIWTGEDYTNTLYSKPLVFSVVDLKLGEKTKIRSMWLLNSNKNGNNYFKDCWGDQYITYNFTKKDQILAGWARTQVGVEGGMGTIRTPFYNRSQLAKAHGNTRSLGVKVSGSHKYINYNVGGFSSAHTFDDWFPGLEYVVNLGVKPLGAFKGKYGNLVLGGSLNGGNATYSYLVSSAYLNYEYKRWNTVLEYGFGNGSNGSTGNKDKKSQGFNGTVAYRVTPKTQVLFRYDIFDPNTQKSKDWQTEYTVGLNHFLKEEALRLILNYTFYNKENGDYGSRIYVGTQVIL